MDAPRRGDLARYGPPAALLAAATIAVLLIKAGLNSGGKSTTTAEALPTTQSTKVRSARTQRLAARVYYTVQPGDTLGAIALHQKTTVTALLRLNPGIDPRTLHSGERIRIR